MDPNKNSPNKKNGDNKKNKNLKGFLTLVAWALVLTVALNFLSAYAGNRSNTSLPTTRARSTPTPRTP